MEAPKEIYVRKQDLDKLSEDGILVELWHRRQTAKTDIKYIRADLAELTPDDMRLAFSCVNEAIGNCEGKTKQEIFEDAFRRFNARKED